MIRDPSSTPAVPGGLPFDSTQIQHTDTTSPGGATRSVSSYLNLEVKGLKRSFGAVDDGTTDCSTVLQNAVNSGKIIDLDGENFKLNSTVTLIKNTRIIGGYIPNMSEGTNYSRFTLAAGITGFKSAASGTPDIGTLAYQLEGFGVSGGDKFLYLPNGGVWMNLKNLLINVADKGIHASAFTHTVSENVQIMGGNYGVLVDPTINPTGESNFDYNIWKNIHFDGQAFNAFNITATIGNTNVWERPTIINIAKDGMVLAGGLVHWSINDINLEAGGGYTGSAATPATTGSITSGTPTLVVASATGLAIGQTLTVQGAGVTGSDLVSVIDNLVGTTVTLHDNAGTNVTNGEVVNYLYSNLRFASYLGGSPSALTIYGGNWGTGASTGSVRYSVDCSSAGTILFINAFSTRPVYDPNKTVSCIKTQGLGTFNIRSSPNASTENFTRVLLGSNGNRAVLPSPEGGDFVVGMRDSNGAGTGTYGRYEVRRFDSNRTCFWYTDPQLKVSGPQNCGFALSRVAPTYGASVAIDWQQGNEFDITATNGTAFTVANPTANAVDGTRITITIRNTSGGALGVVTWDTQYKLSAWTSPATGFSRSIDFKYNGTNWVQVSQTGVDVPN